MKASEGVGHAAQVYVVGYCAVLALRFYLMSKTRTWDVKGEVPFAFLLALLWPVLFCIWAAGLLLMVFAEAC